MTQDQAARFVLATLADGCGVCGHCNLDRLVKRSGISRNVLEKFLRGECRAERAIGRKWHLSAESIEKVEWWIWQELIKRWSHDEIDEVHCPTCRTRFPIGGVLADDTDHGPRTPAVSGGSQSGVHADDHGMELRTGEDPASHGNGGQPHHGHVG